MFLTAAELADLTGYVRPSAQVRWLRANGYRFEIGGDGLRKVRGFHLFLNSHGRRLTYRVYYSMFVEAAEKAGVKDARPNDLRAKAATDAEEQGIDPTRLLGHDKAETTRSYLRNRKAKIVAGPRLKRG